MLGLTPPDLGCPHVSSIWSQETQEPHFSYITLLVKSSTGLGVYQLNNPNIQAL